MTTEVRPAVKDEMAIIARANLRNQEESACISRLAKMVDDLAFQYSSKNSRLVPPHPTNDFMQQALHPDNLTETERICDKT